MEVMIKKFIELNNKMNTLCLNKDLMMRSCIQIGRMECALLNFLCAADRPVCMNDLAEELSVSHSRVTRIVDNLVKKDLVNRYPSSKDRRRWFTEITELGKELSDQSFERSYEIQLEVMKTIPESEWETIHNAMDTYINAFMRLLDERRENG